MIRLNYIISLLFLLLSSIAFAQLDRSKVPEPEAAPVIEMGNYSRFVLKNGLTVLVVENHKLPLVSFRMVLDIDPLCEGDKTGFTSFTGDFLTEGTRNLTNEALAEQIDFMGASLNASSSSVSASGLSKYSEDLISIMSEVIKYPTFPESSFDKILNQYLAGVEAEKKEPKMIANNVVSRVLYGKSHPYGDVMTEETLKAVTIDDCKNYYNTYFKPNVAILAIVGDITLADAKKLTKKYLKDWKKGDVPKVANEVPVKIVGKRVVLANRDDAPQSYINLTNTVDLPKGDPDVIPVSVMNSMLGSGFTGLLFKNLREDKGYTYGAYSRIGSDAISARFNVSSNVRADVTDSSFFEIAKEVNKMRTELLEQDHLEMTKATMAGDFSRSLESAGTIAGFAISIERYHLDKDYFKNYLQRLSEITLEDVKAMAYKYMDADNALYVVVGDRGLEEKLKSIDSDGVIEEFDFQGDKVKVTE